MENSSSSDEEGKLEIEPIKRGIFFFRNLVEGAKIEALIEHGVYICLYIMVVTSGTLKAGQGNVKSHVTAEKLTTS